MTAHALEPLAPTLLPPGVRSRFVAGINGLTMHVLEAGFEAPGRPAVLLLHGFPELAYSWRHVLPALAGAGFHVIAPDQRGYGRTTGRTTGWTADFSTPPTAYTWFNLVRDALALVMALGHHQVHAVVGHDFGSPVAAWCALLRPDVFQRVVLMSAPFGGPPALPFNTAAAPQPARPAAGAQAADIHAALAALPRPRQHYQWYFSSAVAAQHLNQPPQGVHDFLRAYYHHKSADWPAHKTQHQPHALPGWTAESLALLPTYYVMDLGATMPETVAQQMPSPAHIAACRWLPESALQVYSAEFTRTGFQGGLQWYRASTSPACLAELQLMAGRRIDVPALYIAGASDWGTHQRPGAFEAMQTSACSQLHGCHLIDGAGHWVQQEQPAAVNALLLDFLQHASPAGPR